MLLQIKRGFVNGVATAPNVKWVLDHTPTLSKTQRAFVAADWASGRIPYQPTIAEAAMRAGVSPTYCWHALQRESARAEVIAGRVPLVPPSRSSSSSEAKDRKRLVRMAAKRGVSGILELLADIETTTDTNKLAPNGLSSSPSAIFGSGNGSLHPAQEFSAPGAVI
jgi:hypothetical protein